MTTDLTVRHTVEQLVAGYVGAVAEIRDSFARIREAEQRLNELFTLGEWHSIHVRSHERDRVDWDHLDGVEKLLRKEVWGALVERLDLRRMMSIKRAQELDEQLKKGDLPDITEATVYAFVQQYSDALPDMLTEAVIEVYDWLRPRASHYKTNTEIGVGRKIILSHVVNHWGYGEKPWRVNYYYEAHLTALENVFQALDGEGQINKHHRSGLSAAIHDCGADGKGATAYFGFRVFRNGNIHLEVLRSDLLLRFNQIGGGNRLAPAQEAS